MKSLKSGALKIEAYFSDQLMNLLLSSQSVASFVSTFLCEDCLTTHKLRASKIEGKNTMTYYAFDNELLVSIEYAMYGDFSYLFITNLQEQD